MRCDVAVVGGGPAGSAAARALALSGARVAIFDPSHPREKPCGGGLTGRALALLGRARVVERVPMVPIRSTLFESGDAATRFDLGDSAALAVASRAALDQALLDAAVTAGAALIRERVTDCAVDRDRVTLTTSRTGQHQAAFVVGADGAASLVRHKLHRPFARRQLSTAAGYYVHGTSSSEIVLRCIARPAGYIWSFPRQDHLAVGICAQADAAPVHDLRCIVEEWMRRSGMMSGVRLVRYSWPIPSLGPGDFDVERPAGSRWLLAGDAAGLVDPLTREGIFYALQSGELAASALGDAGAPGARYCEQLHDEVFPELARAAALKHAFFVSRFTDLLVEALERSARVRSIMVDLIAGRQAYATLKRRLLRTFEVGLAWRLLKMQVRGSDG